MLARSKTLVWNGPFGAFEMEPFDNGTVEVAEAAAELTRPANLSRSPAAATRSRRSTSRALTDASLMCPPRGGAFLEWLEGKTLPGVEVLRRNRPRTDD